MISLIVTQVVSKQAKELLDKKSIQLKAENIVENILTKDRSSICPMELKAQETRGNGLFYNMIKAIKISN